MSKYQIKVNYDTGSSFHHETDCEKFLEKFPTEEGKWKDRELVFESLEIAKENLTRLKDHHTFILDTKNFGRLSYSKKELGEKTKKAKKQPWYNGKSDYDGTYSAILINDKREPIIVDTFYHGYFETLNSLEIEEVRGEQMRVNFR